jgi:hypothetical protein
MNATGTRGELLVAEKLIKLGFHVSIPLDETQFDLICTLKEKSHRIQVKCTGGIEKAKQPNSNPRYNFNLSRGNSRKISYTHADCDFIICLAMDASRYWIIPVEEIDIKILKIPANGSSKYCKYEYRWDLIS